MSESGLLSRNNLWLGFILIQLGLLFALVYFYKIEYNTGFPLILSQVFSAFVLRILLPPRFRKYIFPLLGVSILIYAFGIIGASLFASTIWICIFIAHLKINHSFKVVVFALLAFLFYAIRSEFLAVPFIYDMLPYIASILMFRMILYLFEIKYGRTNDNLFDSFCYFFMFPNLVFLLYPIVDYTRFIGSYTQENDTALYQKGIRSVLRGMIHILMFRFFYNYMLANPVEINNAWDIFQYLVTSYILILRLSGIFHLCLGLLQLFGYNLPPVFNNYFLASSPSDIWRRVNLYWREFMSKIIYYPIYFKIKAIGARKAIVITTLIVFALTWFLHSYQWFWFQGNFLFGTTNTVFWTVFGLAIATNSLIQQVFPTKKKIKQSFPFKDALKNTIGILLMFSFMSVIWTLWSSTSLTEFIYLIGYLKKGVSNDYLYILLVYIVAFTFIMIRNYVLKWNLVSNIYDETKLKWNAAMCIIPIVLIAFFYMTDGKINSNINLSRVLSNRQRDFDLVKENRGYYEGILGDNAPVLWKLEVGNKKNQEHLMTKEKTLLRQRFIPNKEGDFKMGYIKVNSFGMRDKEYTLEKPAEIYRLALLGGSYEMGSGLYDNENYEAICESKFNAKSEKLEIFNFGVGGYSLIQYVEVFEQNISLYNFDGVIISLHTNESLKIARNLAVLIQNGTDLKYDIFKDCQKRSGAEKGMSFIEILKRLAPEAQRLESDVLNYLKDKCEKESLDVIVLYLPATQNPAANVDIERWEGIFGDKIPFINLKGIYKGLNKEDLWVSNRDSHPNKAAHLKIGQKFYDELLKINIFTSDEGESQKNNN